MYMNFIKGNSCDYLEIDQRKAIILSIAIYLIANMIGGGIITTIGLPIWGKIVPVFLLIYILATQKIILEKNYIIWNAFFLSFCLLSVIWAIDIKVALYVFKNIIPILSTSILMMILIRDENNIYIFFRLFYLCSLFLCFYVIVFTDPSSFEGRGEGLFDGWNLNSIAVDLIFGLFSGFIYNKKYGNSKGWLVLALATALGFYVLMMSGSRRALLMFGTVALLSFWFLFKMKLIYRIAIIICVFFISVTIIFSDTFYASMGARVEEMNNILQGNMGGDTSRLFLLFYGIEWFVDKPCLGYGINCFRVLSNQTDMFAGKNFYAHNNYIELLVDVGLVGLIIYYYPLIRIFIHACISKSYFGKVAIVLLLTIFFSDFFSVGYYLFDSQYFIAICYIMIFSCKKSKINQL